MATQKKPAADITFADLMKSKKVSTMKVEISLDPSIVEARDRAKRDLGAAEIRLGRTPEDPARIQARDEAQAEYDRLEAEAAEASVVFEFRALGRKVLEVLMKTNRPSGAQIDEFREALKEQGLPTNETLTYDPERFPPLLIARSCVSPKMTDEEAFELWDSEVFSRGELGQLFQAAWSVNQVIAR